MAVCTPVTVVPTSLATVAIDTFITELSRIIRNCPADSVSKAIPALLVRSPLPLFTSGCSAPAISVFQHSPVRQASLALGQGSPPKLRGRGCSATSAGFG